MKELEKISENFIVQIEIDNGHYTCSIFNEDKENEDYLFLAFSVEGNSLDEVSLKAFHELSNYRKDEL